VVGGLRAVVPAPPRTFFPVRVWGGPS